MENSQKEVATWAPNLKVLNYYGAQDERRHMRLQIVNEEVEYDVILTTYNMVISSADDRVLFRRQVLKSVHFKNKLHDPHFYQNCGTFHYNIG